MVNRVREQVGKVFCGVGKHDWKTIYRWQMEVAHMFGFILDIWWDWKIVGSKCRRCGHEVRL